MKISPSLLTPCLVALLCFSFTACSSHSSKQTQQKSSQDSAASAQAHQNDEEEVSLSEPEETAAEELEALNQPGAWEYGVSEVYSPQKLGIDPNKYDFPITVNKQVLYYMGLFQGKQRNYFSQWLARSAMYRPYIEAELKKAGLPLDLVFLAMIESGYNPSAFSPARACGLWQFIEGTGQTYGLRIDSYVDERREPEKATKAAIRYLSRLYAQFGDWYLAVAAYNAGERKIDTALKTFNAKDFWEIAVSEGIFMETKRYVPKLIAAIIIARNPEKYGFTDVAYKKPVSYETITVPGSISLDSVAATANISLQELRSLNNELRKNQTPPKANYVLRLPTGTKDLLANNMNKLRPVSTVVFVTHTVQKGDTLASICQRYRISQTTLLKANNLRTARLTKGLRLQVPTTTSGQFIAAKETPRGSQHQVAAASTKTTKATLQVATAATAKTIEPAARKIAKTVPAAAPVVLETGKKRPVSVAKAEPAKATGKQAQAAPAKNVPPTWYVVKNGDTLVTIAKKFQATPQNIRSWNNLSSNSVQTGNKLIVKKG